MGIYRINPPLAPPRRGKTPPKSPQKWELIEQKLNPSISG